MLVVKLGVHFVLASLPLVEETLGIMTCAYADEEERMDMCGA